ncbi:nucleoside hydrolase [Flagellimonas sp. S174]|uniref:nucleoside hydrolase n=1 Tax=Flagellimonas sp. S174 TaxID=3410790 RepID=UPI003BF5CB81
MKLILRVLIFLFPFFISAQHTSPRNVIIDLDTGNEVDDVYALARILLDSSINLVAINATHWQTSHWSIPNTMENSHRLNQQLLAVMDMKTKTNRGAHARMYDWGDKAQHSAAAYEIIAQAHQQKEGKKLVVIALGALTNVTSALFIDNTISDKIKVYWLGSTYDFEKGIFGLTDFNSTMDVPALQLMLHSNVDMHILPVNVARAMKVDYMDMKVKFQNNTLGNYLIKRWNNHLDPLRKKRILWDVALVEAFLNPEWSKSKMIRMSKDNGDRTIKFYQKLETDLMLNDFETTILNFKS